MATTIARYAFSDDTGDGESGDVINAALIGASIYDKINALFTSSVHYEYSGASSLNFRLQRTGGTAGDWFLYLPAASTDLRVYSAADIVSFSTLGRLTMHAPATSGPDLRLLRAGGTASDWFLYLVTGSTDLRLFKATDLFSFTAAGALVPASDNSGSVGTAALRFSLVRAVTITSGDLLFENGWAFTEAEKVGISEPGIALLDADGELALFIGRDGIHVRGGVSQLRDADDLPHAVTTSAERARMDLRPQDRQIGARTELVHPTDEELAAVPEDERARERQARARVVQITPATSRSTADMPFPSGAAVKSRRARGRVVR